MFYGVYYYNNKSIDPTVYLAGFYCSLIEAINRLKKIMPNYNKYINNTVINMNYVGWINIYEFGDFSSNLSVSQPHNAISIM